MVERVRRGTNGSASASCKAGPSSNLGSAPQRRPSLSGSDEDNMKRFSTSYIYNIVCMLASCNIKKKEWQLATKP
jgi:hypothetical protein